MPQVQESSLSVEYGVSMAQRCTLGVGGPAAAWATVADVPSLDRVLALVHEREWPLSVVGGGSNLVVSDRGLSGLVLQLGPRPLQVEHAAGSVLVRVGAGHDWDALVAHTTAQGWGGLECLSGIPGLVGGTPIQNVGAYGQEVSSVIEEVVCVDRRSGAQHTFRRADCQFGYRTSRFKTIEAERWIVWEVVFRLEPGAESVLSYPELKARIGNERSSPARVREIVLAARRSKSMVVDPLDPDSRSCGSFFLNPELERADCDRIAALAGPPPMFAGADGRCKVPAAWLIEQAGIRKGQRWGRAGVSSKHALALVTDPGATATEVVVAARRVQGAVLDRFALSLEPEPRFLGFEAFDSGGLPLS